MNRQYLELPYVNKQTSITNLEGYYIPFLLIGILIIIKQITR